MHMATQSRPYEKLQVQAFKTCSIHVRSLALWETEKLADIGMAGQPTTEILDGLRELERKTSLVFTLLKASVYSIVLQQEIDWGDQAR